MAWSTSQHVSLCPSWWQRDEAKIHDSLVHLNFDGKEVKCKRQSCVEHTLTSDLVRYLFDDVMPIWAGVSLRLYNICPSNL